MEQLVSRKIHINKILYTIGQILILGIILYSVIISFFMNTVGRSMWLDEAALLTNILTRNFFEITSVPLVNNQSAPVLYLYIVKLFSLLGGTSEFVLRLPSFLFYCGLLLFTYLFLKQIKIKLPLIGCALIASLSVLMRYASELKQYMEEAFLVMLILYMYAKYLSSPERKKWFILVAMGFVCIWGGNPCCFVLGGILLVEFLDGIFHKNTNRIREVIAGGIIIIASFGLYFFYWLKPVIDKGFMASYWENNKFPLLFWASKENWELAKQLVFSYLDCFGECKYVVILLVFIGIFLSFFTVKKEVMVISSNLFILLLASSFGFFPIQDRICLFFYPLIIVLIIFAIENVICFDNYPKSLLSILICMLIFSQSQGIERYKKAEGVMHSGEEINGLIEYLSNNINSEQLYLYSDALDVFQYKTGINNHSIGNGNNNVIYGKDHFNNNKNREDINFVLNSPNTYLLFYHMGNNRVFPLFKELTSNGYLYLVKRNYNTPLYYYCKDVKISEINAELQYIDSYEKEGIDVIKIRIKNNGNYYIGNGFNSLYIGTDNGIVNTVIPSQPAPGESCDVEVSMKRVNRRDCVNLQLYLQDQYNFSDLGTSSISMQFIDNRWIQVNGNN